MVKWGVWNAGAQQWVRVCDEDGSHERVLECLTEGEAQAHADDLNRPKFEARPLPEPA